MSYDQILRRIKRILLSEVHDASARVRKEEQDLLDFDEELKRAEGESGTQGRQESGARERPREEGSGASQRESAGQQRSRQSRQEQQAHSGGGASSKRQQPHTEGKRKPGEREDAYYYGVLGVPVTASVEEIRAAYRKLMRRYHPDTVATLGPAQQKAASDKAQAVNEAYQIIARRRTFK